MYNYKKSQKAILIFIHFYYFNIQFYKIKICKIITLKTTPARAKFMNISPRLDLIILKLFKLI